MLEAPELDIDAVYYMIAEKNRKKYGNTKEEVVGNFLRKYPWLARYKEETL